MPKTQSGKSVHTVLAAEDSQALDAIARGRGVTRSEVAREALRFYITNHEKLVNEERDSKLEIRIKKMEDRLAGLMARTAIDVGVVYTLMWRNLPGDREATLKSAYTIAVDRLRQKLTGSDAQIKELAKR